MEDVVIRSYRLSDLPALITVYRDAVHHGAAGDYSPEELAAWAPESVDAGVWAERLSEHKSRVAERAGEVIGFAEMTEGGHLAMLYVHSDHHRGGIASALLSHLEVAASLRGIAEITTESSRTALPFFEQHGYRLIEAQSFVTTTS